MRLSSAESAVTGSSGSAGESTTSSSRRSSSPASFTRSSATTVPLTVTADSAVSALSASFSALAGSRFSSTTWSRPVSSRTITNCIRFWSRSACTQPRIVTRSPIFSPSSAISVRVTAGTLSERAGRHPRARWPRWLGRRFGAQHDLDRELARLRELEALDRARVAKVLRPELQRAQALRRVVDLDVLDRRAHPNPSVGLRLANLAQHVRGDLECQRLAIARAVRGSGALEVRHLGPRRTVHRALLPPRPHLLANEREERRQQALKHRQRRLQRKAHRGAPLARAVGARIVVAPALDELEVVVAVPPEELLRALQRARVVVVLEALRRRGHDSRQAREQRAVERVRDDVSWRR